MIPELSSAHNVEQVKPWSEVEQYVPQGYCLNDTGVSLLRSNDEVILSGPVWISSTTRSKDGNEWGVVITWIDQDKVVQSCAVSYSRLHERGAPLAGELASRGMMVIPGKHSYLMTYLGSYALPMHLRRISVAKVGWVDCSEDESPKFVTPNRVISLSDGEDNQIMFQPEEYSPTIRTMRSQGTIGQWRKFVAEPCLDHPVLLFSLCTAFAGPLLKYASIDSGGFHLYGASSKGKTTALQVAASVWGPGADPANSESAYITRWNTTGNALEATAAAHNDVLLCLDEMGTCDARDMSKVVYDLFGGRGKSRLNKSSLLQATRTWRIQAFSTGEISLKQKIEEAGGIARTGQLIRMLDIPINDGVVDCDVCKEPRKLIESLKMNAERFYGHAGPDFILGLIGSEADNNAIRNRVQNLVRTFSETIFETIDLESFQQRAIRRFAVVAVAGHIAIDLGLIPGDKNNVTKAVCYVADRWLGDSANQPELVRALIQVREFILSQQARFRKADDATGMVRELVGYTATVQNVNTYLFTLSGFEEATRGFNSRVVKEELKSRGYLFHDKGRPTSRHIIAGVGRISLLAIKQSFLTDDLHTSKE